MARALRVAARRAARLAVAVVVGLAGARQKRLRSLWGEAIPPGPSQEPQHGLRQRPPIPRGEAGLRPRLRGAVVGPPGPGRMRAPARSRGLELRRAGHRGVTRIRRWLRPEARGTSQHTLRRAGRVVVVAGAGDVVDGERDRALRVHRERKSRPDRRQLSSMSRKGS